jgi:hypothetical protein
MLFFNKAGSIIRITVKEAQGQMVRRIKRKKKRRDYLTIGKACS